MGICRPTSSDKAAIERGDPTSESRDVQLAGIFFLLSLSVVRIDTPALQPEALAFVPHGLELELVRVRVH